MPAATPQPSALALAVLADPVPVPQAGRVAVQLIAHGLSRPGSVPPRSAFRDPTSAHLLLAADQLLALRWVRSSGWDCYLPAALLNAWHLALTGALPKYERGTRNAES